MIEISFTYLGGRKVKGEVIVEGEYGYLIKLHTDYIGKNVDWFAGEEKEFRKSMMKNVIKEQK